MPKNKKSDVANILKFINFSARSNLDEDMFGFRNHAERIKNYLENCSTPHVIGIYGGWGSGKTTLKNFILRVIEKDKNGKLYPIDFCAWEYELCGGIVKPLIAKLVQEAQLEEDEKLKRVSSILGFSASDIALKMLTKGQFGLQDIEDIRNKIEGTFSDYVKFVDEIKKAKKDFSYITNEITKNKKKEKVVIFIDELDRCNPEYCIEILESIKNFFDVENCIFLILVDDDILASYIDKKYEDTLMDGQKYLEKIINTKFKIPQISSSEIKDFMSQLSEETSINIDPKTIIEISGSFNPRRLSKLTEKIFYYKNRIKKIDVDDLPGDIASLSGPARNKACLMMIIIYELYPKIYRNLNTWSRRFMSKVKTQVTEFETRDDLKAKDLLSEYKYSSEEIHILNLVFKTFKPSDEMFSAIDRTLRKLLII